MVTFPILPISPFASKETDETEHGGPDVEEDYAFGKDSVLAAIEAVRAGKCVVVTDDEGRENEGDLIFAAEKVSSLSAFSPCDVNESMELAV